MTLLLVAALSSTVLNLDNLVNLDPNDNIRVHKLGEDEHASEFVIWVKNNVPLHIHRHHTEIIYILDGEGVMRIGDEKRTIQKGDYIRVPEGTPHGVTVTSEDALKVLSVQTPKFLGKDRHLVEE